VTGSSPPVWLGIAAAFSGAWAWTRFAIASVRRLTGALSDTSPVKDGRQVWTFGLDGVRIGADVADSQFGWRVFDRVPAGQSAIGLASGNVYFALPVELTLLKGSKRGW
jgi:hypothetical protein